jgi:phosphatidylglycerophosphatase A
MNRADRVRWLLATGGGLGQAPIASGTFGSLGGVVLAIVLQLAVAERALPSVLWGVAALLLLFGCRLTPFVARTFPSEDPKPFVLDEIVGYLITVAIWATWHGAPTPLVHVVAFVLFRATDVLKLPPAGRLEDLPGAIGIMLDDVAAGVQAGLLLLVAGWLGLS